MTEEEKMEKKKLRELRNEVLNQMGQAIQIEMDLVKSSESEGGPNAYIKSIAAQLRLHGAKSMRIEFMGGGDSGQIEGVVVIDNDGEGTAQYAYQHQGEPFFKTISEWAYNFIAANSYTDWYNNEGGSGYIEFDLENGKFNWKVYYNVTQSHLGDSNEEDI